MDTNRTREKDFIKIGLNIMYYRKAQGFTQEQLADKVGYSQHHIQQVETASTVPSVALLLDIADALQIPPNKLFEFR